MKKMLTAVLALALVSAVGCEKKEDTKQDKKTTTAAQEEGLKTDKGVDADKKVIKIGTLNDESGRAVLIGKPYAAGKRILAEQVNAGGSGILPEGWTVELVERDHGYNPQKSVQAYEDIKNDVLMIATSFGTPPTLPLVPKLQQDKMVAMPASLSSKMAESEFTPPIGAAYYFEAMRALDWAIEDAGGKDKVKAGIIYQNDDYGQDGIHGWEQAAKKLEVELVAQQSVKPGQSDVTAAVKALQDAGANYVMLTVLPSSTGPILGTAAQLKYMPKWIGNTPAWADLFYQHEKLPKELFANFYVASGLPFWGEESEGMKQFLAAYEKYGKDDPKDWYILLSYAQGLAALDVAKRAIEAGDITREGYLKQLHTVTDFTASGMLPAIDWSKAPYIVSTKTRVLKPDFENKSFTVVADYAAPKSYEAPK
jgi:ABC-type branched-subunit amino acid transport system substrate-binding protein